MRMKILLMIALALVAMLMAGCGQTTQKTSQPSNNATQTQARVPAYYPDVKSAGALAATLSPDKFIGPAKDAYKVAQEIPNTLAQLPCYCYCDMHMGHKSLHSCFEDTHASQCAVCVSEALEAYEMHQNGMSPAQIRERIVAEYSKQ
jgi:outer membrane murein-binding lipoprotein Lpp